jgi:sec-independent protein translocase protein TatB
LGQSGQQLSTHRLLRIAGHRLLRYDLGMSFPDTVVLFILALLLFGPKKLPQIARQVGKALAEFRRASNEFKAQIEAEISQLEFEERKKAQEQNIPKPKPISESIASSRFQQAENIPAEGTAENSNEAPAAEQDLNSPAHSTHA